MVRKWPWGKDTIPYKKLGHPNIHFAVSNFYDQYCIRKIINLPKNNGIGVIDTFSNYKLIFKHRLGTLNNSTGLGTF